MLSANVSNLAFTRCSNSIQPTLKPAMMKAAVEITRADSKLGLPVESFRFPSERNKLIIHPVLAGKCYRVLGVEITGRKCYPRKPRVFAICLRFF